MEFDCLTNILTMIKKFSLACFEGFLISIINVLNSVGVHLNIFMPVILYSDAQQ